MSWASYYCHSINGRFEYLREYYGEDSLRKGFVICRVKKDFSIGKGIKAINGTQFDF
jgi:hypothetical protein